jgi:hypothetical protein
VLQHIGGEGDVGDAVAQGQQVPVGDDGPLGRLRTEFRHIRLEEIGARTSPPELLGEVPATAADIDDGTPGDGTVVRLDLVDGVTGEQRIAGFGIVLLMEEGPEESKGPSEGRVLDNWGW